MFRFTPFNGDVNGWQTGQVTRLSSIFFQKSVFNKPLPWKTGNVEDFRYAFADASSFSQDLDWNTSKATSMFAMFRGAEAFQGNVSSFDTSLVTGMEATFEDAVLFNSPGIGIWNVGSLTNSNRMFQRARSFRQDLSAWQVGQVTEMIVMFFACDVFSQDLCSWGPLLVDADTVITGILIFSDTLCPNTDPPSRTKIPPGPYCYDCVIIPKRSPTNSPTLSPVETPTRSPVEDTADPAPAPSSSRMVSLANVVYLMLVVLAFRLH
jgi:surface protein